MHCEKIDNNTIYEMFISCFILFQCLDIRKRYCYTIIKKERFV